MAQLDYIRLASFDFNYATMLSEFMNKWPGDWNVARWLQYKGWRNESLFVGVGEQSLKRHMITSCSGLDSNKLAEWMTGYLAFYCTRIDLQRTIVKPKHTQLRHIRQQTKSDNTSLIESKDNHTLYIGSRTSDLFTRLYEKDLDEMYLRLEFELKGARSRAAWGGLVHGKTPDDIYSYYLRKSKLPDKVKSWFQSETDTESFKVDREIILLSARIKLKWLRSLDVSMEKAMSDHEIGEQVKILVRSWSKFANKLDEDNQDN